MAFDVENLVCGYGSREILRGVDLSLCKGQVLTVLGPNGIGKTTLFKSMLGFVKPFSGAITLEGKDITSFSRNELARKIAYVPQTQNISFAYTVEDVVLMGRAPHLKLLQQPRSIDFEIVSRALAVMGVTHLAKKTYTEISGGEQQMVAIARALAQEPTYLIMDEPTASLDFGNQVHVLERILDLVDQGIGVLLTTHDPSQAFTLKSDAILLQRGNHLSSGYYRDVLTKKALQDAYGVEVLIRTVPYKDRDVQCCMALPSKQHHHHCKGDC